MSELGLYPKYIKNKKVSYIKKAILALILILGAVIALFPMVYMIMSSFGPATDSASASRTIIPRNWSLDSYKAFFAFSKYSLVWIWNRLNRNRECSLCFYGRLCLC